MRGSTNKNIIHFEDFESGWATDWELAWHDDWTAVNYNPSMYEDGTNWVLSCKNIGSESSLCVYNAETVSADCWARCILDSVGTNTGNYIGVSVRAPNASTHTSYKFMAGYDGLRLERVVSGTVTLLDSSTDIPSDGDELLLEITGNEIRCYVEGVLVTDFGTSGVVTDSNITAGGMSGISMRSTGSGEPYGDNFGTGEIVHQGSTLSGTLAIPPPGDIAGGISTSSSLSGSIFNVGDMIGDISTSSSLSSHLSAEIGIGGTISTSSSLSGTAIDAGSIDFYISAAGSDSNDGDSEGQAWETITKLNTEIAAGNLDNSVVGFRRGDTWEGIGIVISSRSNITFKAYGTGNKPIISGLSDIPDSWSVHNSNIHSYSNAGLPDEIRYISVNGTIKTVKQWADGWTPLTSSGSVTTAYDDQLGGSDDDYIGAELVTRTSDWSLEMRRVTDYTASTGLFTYSPAMSYSSISGWMYLLQNHVDFLTTNQDWAHNTNNDTIYLYTGGVDPTTTIKASTVDNLVSITSGTNIIFENIEFRFANVSGINAQTCNGVDIDNCDFEYIIDAFIFNEGQNTDTTNCTFSQIGQNAISIIRNTETGSTGGILIRDNTFNNIGDVVGVGGYRGYGDGLNAIQINFSSSSTVQYNYFNRIGYKAIAFAISGGISVLDNYVNQANYITDDGSGIYFWHCSPDIISGFTTCEVLRNIVLNGVTGLALDSKNTGNDYYAAHGIYLDDGCGDFDINYNTCDNNRFGLFLHNTFETRNNYNHYTRNREAGIFCRDNLNEIATLVANDTMLNATIYSIVSRGTLDFTLYGADDNNPGTRFTSTGTPTLGTGDSLIQVNTSYPNVILNSFTHNILIANYDDDGHDLFAIYLMYLFDTNTFDYNHVMIISGNYNTSQADHSVTNTGDTGGAYDFEAWQADDSGRPHGGANSEREPFKQDETGITDAGDLVFLQVNNTKTSAALVLDTDNYSYWDEDETQITSGTVSPYRSVVLLKKAVVTTLAGGISTSSSLSGSIFNVGDMIGDISTSSSLSGSIYNIGGMVGSITATSSLSGVINASGELIGSQSSSSVLSGNLVASSDSFIIGNIPTSSSLSASLLSGGILIGYSTLQTSLIGNLLAIGSIQGSISCSSVTSAIQSSKGSLLSNTPTYSSLSGSIFSIGGMMGSIIDTSSLSGIINASGELICNQSSSSILSGSLVASSDSFIIGNISTSSSLSANILSGGRLTGDSILDTYLVGNLLAMGNTQGNISCSSVISATQSSKGSLLSNIPTSSSLSGSIRQKNSIVGIVYCTSILSATLSATASMSGLSMGTSYTFAIVGGVISLIGTVYGTSIMVFTLHATGHIAGAIDNISVAGGIMGGRSDLSGLIDNRSILSLTLYAGGLLHGNSPNSSTGTCIPKGSGKLVGNIIGDCITESPIIGRGNIVGGITCTNTINTTIYAEGSFVGDINGLSILWAIIDGQLPVGGSANGSSLCIGYLSVPGVYILPLETFEIDSDSLKIFTINNPT